MLFPRKASCTYHFASLWVHPRETHRNPGYSFGLSFFPTGYGSCLVLEMTLLDHGDRGQSRATGKMKSALPGMMVDVWKWAKGVPKNWIHLCLIFANEGYILYFCLTIKGWRRLLCYSWQLVKYIMLWVFILPPREGLFVINFMPLKKNLIRRKYLYKYIQVSLPLPRCFEWLFVCQEKKIRRRFPRGRPMGKQLTSALLELCWI